MPSRVRKSSTSSRRRRTAETSKKSRGSSGSKSRVRFARDVSDSKRQQTSRVGSSSSRRRSSKYHGDESEDSYLSDDSRDHHRRSGRSGRDRKQRSHRRGGSDRRRHKERKRREPVSDSGASDGSYSSDGSDPDDRESRRFRRDHKNTVVRKHGGPTEEEEGPEEDIADPVAADDQADGTSGGPEEEENKDDTPVDENTEAQAPTDGLELSEEVKAADEEAVVASSDVLEIMGKDGGDAVKGAPSRVGQGSGGDYGAAYSELYEQLCARMVHRIMRFFYKLYARVKDTNKFKERLVDIQRWNQEQINEVTKGFVRHNRDIIRVFRFAYAADVLVMSVVVQRDEASTDVEVDCPKFSDFCHRCFIETARSLFDHAGILDPNLSAAEKLQVHDVLYKCVSRGIARSLRMMVPIHKIAPVHEEDEEQFDFIDNPKMMDGLDLDDDEMQEMTGGDTGIGEADAYPAKLDDDGESSEDNESSDEESDENSDDISDDDLSDEEDSDEDSESESESSSEEEEEEDTSPPPRSSRKQRRNKMGRTRGRPQTKPKEDDGSLSFF